MPMMNEEMPMREDMPAPDDTEQASVFLPKSSLGGKECKPGDSLTLKVVDVDAETGDVEAVLEGYSHQNSSDRGYEADFDRAMPEESEE